MDISKFLENSEKAAYLQRVRSAKQNVPPPLFPNEKEFRHHVAQFLVGKTMTHCGFRVGGGFDSKKLSAKILRVTEDRKVEGIEGRPDIIVEHDGIDVSYKHALADKFRIECKQDSEWKDAINQAIGYKHSPTNKYHTDKGKKWLEVAVCTPSLWLNGCFVKEKCSPQCDTDVHHRTCQQFDIDRILWKLGIGLLKKEQGIMITVNEGDKIRIQ